MFERIEYPHNSSYENAASARDTDRARRAVFDKPVVLQCLETRQLPLEVLVKLDSESPLDVVLRNSPGPSATLLTSDQCDGDGQTL